MDWSDERWVRVYTRDTTTWKLLDWRARTVLLHLLRKVDRAGVIEVGDDGLLGLAAVLELPVDVVETGVAQLTRGAAPTVVDTGSAFVVPRFLDAQETPQSYAQRQRESRARRRDKAMRESRIVTESQSVTGGHENVRDRHTTSRDVTPRRDETNQTRAEDPPPAGARAIPPTPSPPAPTPVPALDADQVAANRDARRAVQLEIRGELERARREVAAELGLEDRGLLAQDPGERELAMHLVNAGPTGMATARAQALHAIAMAKLEALRDRSLQWLTGAVFAERTFRRLVAMTAEDVTARSRKSPRASPTRATPEHVASARVVLERLAEDSGVAWRFEDGHAAPVLSRLAEGHTELELRAVATYCGDEWRDDERMIRQLTPDVIFGEKFSKYLAQARARYGAQIDQTQPRPPDEP